MNRRRFLRIALILTLGATAACGGGEAQKPVGSCPKPQGVVSVGERIPTECSFERLDGNGVLSLASLAGKPAVINFWATWCADCIREMPQLQKAFSALGDRVSFIGADLLNVQAETRSQAVAFARRTGARYTLVYDNGGVLYSHFSARLVMPVTIFVTATGVVAHRRFGPLDEKQIRDLVAAKLGVR